MGIKINKYRVVLGIALLLTSFAVITAPVRPNIDNDYKNYLYDFDFAKELDHMIVLEQKTSYTCGITTMAIVKTYLGFETSEEDIRKELGIENREKGMLPHEYLRYANHVFEPLSYSVALLNPDKEETIVKIIIDSLSNDLPVIIFYAREDDWSKPDYNTHYAVIYGIDVDSGMVKLSNPYGYREELTLSELYEGLSFANYQSEPIDHRIGRMLGILQKNNLFILTKTDASELKPN